jgi:hypothetical protein
MGKSKPRAMNSEETKSLAQLTGIDWGTAPESVGSLARDRHELRQTPLGGLSIPALKRLLSLDFQDDCNYLIPYSLQRLAVPPADAEGLSHYCNLLLAVLLNQRYDWLQRPELVRQARQLVERACYALYRLSDEAEQTSDIMEYYRVLVPDLRMEASLYGALAEFEQRLSKVEPAAAPNGGPDIPLAGSSTG